MEEHSTLPRAWNGDRSDAARRTSYTGGMWCGTKSVFRKAREAIGTLTLTRAPLRNTRLLMTVLPHPQGNIPKVMPPPPPTPDYTLLCLVTYPPLSS